jgi:hypothetical protein
LAREGSDVAQTVARRQRRRKLARVSRQQRQTAQRQVRAGLLVEMRRVVSSAIERALAAEVTALVGRERYGRRKCAPPGGGAVGACSRCGPIWRRQLVRAGSYRRTLLTVVAAVVIRMPRLGCRCRGTVRWEYTTVAPYERVWGDVQERARHLAGLCLSLRDVSEVLALDNRQPLARSTLNGWVQQAGGAGRGAAQRAHRARPTGRHA